jgi:AcrR family transcriptional regulator
MALVGLRERKKARTRAEIQHHALRLFREQGYAATTISQIADASEVSESTFFRYFPSKEAVVLEDDFDDPLLAALAAQPAELGPIQAVRGAVRAVFGALDSEERADLRERTVLAYSAPELRAAMGASMLEALEQVAQLLAGRLKRPPNDLAVRTLAGALVGAMIAITLNSIEDPRADYVQLIDSALEQLEKGLPGLR